MTSASHTYIRILNTLEISEKNTKIIQKAVTKITNDPKLPGMCVTALKKSTE